MSKSSYREYFAECRRFLKMKYFLKLSGISESNFCLFMKGDAYDYTVSIEKLDSLKNNIKVFCSEIV